MAYSTGSGDHIQLMNAVLSHAVADGWVEAGGVGTGWPISKGNIRGVDFDFSEVSTDDRTGLLSVAKTERRLRLGLGTAPANATANVAENDCLIPNMEYVFSEWHIFSDPSLCDYVHVVVKFSTGTYSDVWGHFGFGELDNQGASGHVAYVTGIYANGYARTVNDWDDFHSELSNPFGWNWLAPSQVRDMFGGRVGNRRVASTISNFKYLMDGSDLPIPQGSGWPLADTVIEEGFNVWMANQSSENTNTPHTRNSAFQNSTSFNYWPFYSSPQPFSGSVTLGPMPIFLCNSSTPSLQMIQVGIAPNIRMCSMNGYNSGDEVTFGSETWVLFPMLRKTDNSEIGVARTVTSGSVGFAYKKVL